MSCYHGVLFAAQTVPTGRNFDRWKPETSMNSSFFPFSIPIRAIFDSVPRVRSTPSRLLFTPILFNNLRK